MILGDFIYLAFQDAQEYTHPARFQRQPGDNPSAYGVVYQDITLETEDGFELAAWFEPATGHEETFTAYPEMYEAPDRVL